MTTKNTLLHSTAAQALLNLSDLEKSVCRLLVEGEAAGKLELIHQLFPPQGPLGIHDIEIPACFTIRISNDVTLRLNLIISLVDVGDSGRETLVFGSIESDQRRHISQVVGASFVPDSRWVAVKYNPVTRKGSVYMHKDAWTILESYSS
jgi:hypothetical protein